MVSRLRGIWVRLFWVGCIALLSACGGSSAAPAVALSVSGVLPSGLLSVANQVGTLVIDVVVNPAGPGTSFRRLQSVRTVTGSPDTFSAELGLPAGEHTLGIDYRIVLPNGTVWDAVFERGLSLIVVDAAAVDLTTLGTSTFTYPDDDGDSASNLRELREGTDPGTVTVNVRSLVPPVQVSVTDLTPDQGGQLRLTYVPLEPLVTAHRIYRRTATTGFTLAGERIGTFTATQQVFDDSGLTDGATYFYVIRSFDGLEESPDSSEVSAIPVDNLVPTAQVRILAPDGSNAGVSAVSVDATIEVTFSEAVGGVDGTSLSVSSMAGDIVGNVAYDAASFSASFTPQVSLVRGTGYTVSLSSAISDGTGNLQPTQQLFTTAGAQWGTETLLDGRPLAGVPTLATAVAANGTALAVWNRADGSVDSLVARVMDVSGNWAIETLIETGTGGVDSAQLAMDAAGNGIALWRQEVAAVGTIMANHYTAGSGWGSAVAISDGVTPATAPQLALDVAGNALTVWLQNTEVHASRFAVASGWDASSMVLSTGGSASDPQVVLSDAGSGAALWVQPDVGFESIFSATYNAGWGAVALLENSNFSAFGPRAGITSSGDIVAVWVQQDASLSDRMHSSRYSVANGSWSGASNLTTQGHLRVPPAVGVDRAANALAVWVQSHAFFPVVKSKLFDGQWQSGERLVGALPQGVDPVLSPALAIRQNEAAALATDTEGNGLAVWVGQDGGNDTLVINRYDGVSGWQGPGFLPTTNGSGALLPPAVAMGPSGDAVVVWQRADGIYAVPFQ